MQAALANAQLGNDPQATKAEARARAAITLALVSEQYLDRARERLKPRSFDEVQRHLRRHWAPLGQVPLDNLSRASIAARLSQLTTENGYIAANRARASLSALFTWAMREGLTQSNPVVGTNRPAEERSRDRVLSGREVSVVWHSCRADDYGRIVRLLLLTGQRREEVGCMAGAKLT
jgi:integrase